MPKPTLQEWHVALGAAGANIRREGHDYRFAPCPSCGNGERRHGWVRQGDREIVGGCNSGCSFPDIARAVFPDRPPAPSGRPRDAEPAEPPDPRGYKDDDFKHSEPVRARWEQAKPAKEVHPYFKAKDYEDMPHGMRVEKDGTLLIPRYRVGLPSLVFGAERISPEGDKWVKKGAPRSRPNGGHFVVRRPPRKPMLYILCEGIATAWAITKCIDGTHLDTTQVVCCFSAGNLGYVTTALLKKHPKAEIRLALDNDRHKGVLNTGVNAGRKVAAAHPGRVKWCVPDFHRKHDHHKPTDFDDLYRLQGKAAVRKWLDPDMAAEARINPKPKPDPEPAQDRELDAEPDTTEYVRRRDHHVTQERFRCDPAALAHRLLDRMADRILIVMAPEGSTALLRKKNGLWCDADEPWRLALISEIDDLRSAIAAELVADGGSGAATKANRRTNRTHRALDRLQRLVPDVRTVMHSAWLRYMAPHVYTADFPRPQIVTQDQLDGDLDYMGFENGVVNLHTGKLLDPVAGADHFVTRSTGVRFDPSKAPDAERLLKHLPDDLRTYWTQALASMVRGRPSKRIWLVVGERDSGKTTVFNAVNAAFGPYARSILSDALVKHRGNAAHTGTAAFGHPTRFVFVEEPATGQLDTALLKAVSGGGWITVKQLYKDPITVKATASLVIFANPGASVPRLGMSDPALAQRVRELPYPPVPEGMRDSTFRDHTVETTDFREAVCAYLIATGIGLAGPPEDPQSVRIATQQRLELDLSAFENFQRRIVPGHHGDFLPNDLVWHEWCEFNGVNPENPPDKVGNYTKRSFGMRLSRTVSGLPKSSEARIGGVQKLGRKGWRLES